MFSEKPVIDGIVGTKGGRDRGHDAGPGDGHDDLEG
jgi:hypothetical protein